MIELNQGLIQDFHYGGAAGPDSAVVTIEGALNLFNRAQSWAKRAHFRARRAPLLEKGAPYLLRGAVVSKKAPFRTRRAALLAGSA